MEQKENDKLTPMQIAELIDSAIKARERAYTPYSHFQVGAALLSTSGRTFSGCNVENASYSVTNCAERTAFFKAVSEGVRQFRAIAIVGAGEGSSLEFCPPCGVCRQVMAEFCDGEDFEIILAKSSTDYKIYKLDTILPLAFSL